MDDQAAIEAQIQFELDNINLDADEDIDDDIEEIEDLNDQLEDELELPDEIENYIKRIQDQSSRFELELQECDELLEHSNVDNENASTALLPYDDHNLLVQLANDCNLNVEEYRKKILDDIENDNDIITDELEGLVDPEVPEAETTANDGDTTLLQITEHGESGQTAVVVHDDRMSREINQAVLEGIVPEDAPVLQDNIPVDRQKNGQVALREDIQRMLREQLEKLEQRYQDRIDNIKKEEAYRRDEAELQERRVSEERQYTRQEQEREKQKVKLEQELAQRQMEKEIEENEKQMQESVRKFQAEMSALQQETEREKRQLEMAVAEETQRQLQRQKEAATNIQRLYRGYRIRKETKPTLDEMREERKQQKLEERIKEVEVELQKHEEEKQHQAETERQKQEEERLKKEKAKQMEEEVKRQKELEKKQKEEEKRRQKEEEERKKQEEKKRKEEEKRQKEEEKRLKKEEEKRRKEEEKKRKEEEKRHKEEEEKMRKEEEKRRKEEQKRMKEEEEKRLKEEEKRKKEEEKQLKEEELRKKQEDEQKQQEEKMLPKEETKREVEVAELKETSVEKQSGHNSANTESIANGHIQGSCEDANTSVNNTPDNVSKAVQNGDMNDVQKTDTQGDTCSKEKTKTFVRDVQDNIPGTPKGGMIPHPPSPRKQLKESTRSSQDSSQKKDRQDMLPEKLETLRMRFIKDCLSWSKVSNEPWKLKPVSGKKPLRRPSSAKKLPPVPEDIILKAGKVASLKLVTTVQLHDLPGNNLTSLGQCWGLKHLVLDNCNVVALDSLTHCRQLQYLNVQGNKIEYIDLKDLGNLQYLNVSENRLTSVHGLDSCTNLRWLDISHNNITKLGGLGTLRRLHTLLASCNQLISTEGLDEVPTLQRLDVSENHLQSLDHLHKLCLLLYLDASANNLQQLPKLTNQVLLQELLLNDNSISSLDSLSTTWLPLLCKLQLGSNSIETLSSLSNFILLRELDVSSNQLLEADCLVTCVQDCLYLETFHLEDNPVMEDLTDSFYEKLVQRCPRLLVPPPFSAPSTQKQALLKPRTSYEAMCLMQGQTLKDQKVQLDNSLRSQHTEDELAHICDSYFKFCEKTFSVSVEFRSAHEYGEVTVTMPTAPVTPRSGSRVGRHKEKYINPKDMFENALKATESVGPTNDKTDHSLNNSATIEPNKDQRGIGNVVNSKLEDQNKTKTFIKAEQTAPQVNPKDLFEQALKSATRPGATQMLNGHIESQDSNLSTSSLKLRNKAATTIQAFWRSYSVRKEISEHTRFWLAATTIQAAWRGYWVRKRYRSRGHGAVDPEDIYKDVDPNIMEYLHSSATKIQAVWRGYVLRKTLLAALEYAQCDFDEEPDEDAMLFDGDFDLNKFIGMDENLLDSDWKPPETPDIPASHPVLRKPPSGRPHIPPINAGDPQPPNNPRRAWRNFESPISETGMMPRPPSSVASATLTGRSHVSKKEERLTEEWGFKDSSTAHLMVKRAKKMKYNAEKRKKLSKLDPKQRLAVYRKLQEVSHPHIPTVPLRKTLPRKEYFQARQEEINRKDDEKRAEFHVRASRTYQWLHTQVGDHVVSDSVINPGMSEGPRYINTGENLPGLQPGRRIHLVSSPGSLDLQSVNSVSSAGQLEKPRRLSAGSTGSNSKLPPIQNTSAPSAHVKERMSFRNPKNQNHAIGWGGGRKRGNLY